MARFWFATFEAAQPNGSGLAIEVFENGSEYAVLFCTVDNPNKPAKVTCLVGFANGAHSCAVWCDRGFPLVDAVVKRQNDRIQVSAACFLNSAAAIDYEAEVASIIGIAPEDASGRTERLVLSYEQSLMTPHSVFPATWLTQQQISWTRPRSSVKRRKPTPLAIDLGDPRYPKLKPFESGQRTPVAFWSGTIDLAQGNNPPARGVAGKSCSARCHYRGPGSSRDVTRLSAFLLSGSRMSRCLDFGSTCPGTAPVITAGFWICASGSIFILTHLRAASPKQRAARFRISATAPRHAR